MEDVDFISIIWPKLRNDSRSGNGKGCRIGEEEAAEQSSTENIPYATAD